MFDIGPSELLLIFVVALLVIGPERLPSAVKTASLWIGRFRRSFHKIKSEVERELNADEIRRQLHNESILAEVEDAKKGWLQQQQVSRSQDAFLTSTMNNYLEFDRTMIWNAELEEKIANLTAAQVSAAFEKYIIPEKITYIKAGDFAKSAIKP